MAYAQMRFLFQVTAKLFFRQVDVVGAMRIPESGPVIFVANHANQFVDPIMLIAIISRVVRFLIAAKSLVRPVIGELARGVQAIGVDRPQDLATKGSGTISVADGATIVTGVGTSFRSQVEVGTTLKVGDVEVTVCSIGSDTSCIVTPSHASLVEASYMLLPKVDQHAVYNNVHAALKGGDCIGIFPEGGSHDRATMLDLKPGVAIMALGAMQAGAGPVQICPCGLNYFEPYKFRSRVVVEFGDPFTVPQDLVDLYGTDKRGAVQALMNMIEDAMHRVMPGARDYGELQAIITCRALWKPQDRKLSPEEDLKITQTFAKGVQLFRDDPRIKECIEQVQAYNNSLQAAGIKDRDVRMNLVSNWTVMRTSFMALAEVVVLIVPALVIYAIFSPVAVVTYLAAMHEKRTALAASAVKVKALDVVASKKITTGLVVLPIYGLVLSAVVAKLTHAGILGFFILSVLIWPLATMVGCVVCDRFYKALADCLINISGRRGKPLLEQRAILQKRIREMGEEFGPKVVDDFSKKRIISKEELDSDRYVLEPLLVSSGSSASVQYDCLVNCAY